MMGIDDIQRPSRCLAKLATVILAILSAGLAVEAVTIRAADDHLSAVYFGLIYRLPFAFYLFAIWKMREAFLALANGALFDHIIPSLLRWIGISTSAGALVTIFVSPLLLRLSFGSEAGGLANFDGTAIMLAIVGMMLILLSRLFQQASEMRAELDEFF